MKKEGTMLASVALLALTAIGGSWLFAVLGRDREPPISTKDVPILVSVRRIEPPSEADDVIYAARGSVIKAVYRIRNDGLQTLRGLTVAGQCNSCQETQRLPESLAPGEVSDFAFTTRAPDAGTFRESVPVLYAGQIVATLNLTIKSPAVIPTLEEQPEMRRITFIKGDPASRELNFTTIERRTHVPWVKNVALLTEGVVNVDAPHVHDRPHPDVDLVRRSYRIRLSAEDVPAGKYEVLFQFKTTDDSELADKIRMLDVEVVESLVLVPRELEFALNESQPLPKRIRVVRRFGSQSIAVEDYDSSVIKVSPETNAKGEVVALAITPVIRARQDSVDTTIVLRVADEKRVEIGVRLRTSSH